jgi:citrate synthase
MVKKTQGVRRGADREPIDVSALGFVDATTAARTLGVSIETLYTYVSRRWIRRVARADGRGHLYVRVDVDRLRAKREGKKGKAPAAGGALRWGDPILDSALTAIGDDGPRYRGRRAIDLAARGVSFESTAELLWTGELPDERPRWEALGDFPARPIASSLPSDANFAQVLQLSAAMLVARDRPTTASSTAIPALDLARGRSACRRLAASLCLAIAPDRFDDASARDSVAEITAVALGAKEPRVVAPAIEKALILCADHELNVSAFAVRVVASSGADLCACLAAGLAALSGPRHGGVSRTLEAFLDEMGPPERARAAVEHRLRRGESIPGFGHPLYPQGDPRADVLLDLAREIGGAHALRSVTALARTMRDDRRAPATLDVGLLALATALGLPRGSAFALFAVGRTAGWIAHALEQRQDAGLLRPRARYVGVGAEVDGGITADRAPKRR